MNREKIGAGEKKKMNVAQAKRIPLADILARLECFPHHTRGVDVWYASPFRRETQPSFKINAEKNIWYDHGSGVGGTVIDFVLHYFGLSAVSEALRKLSDLDGLAPAVAPSPALRAPRETAASDTMTVQKMQALQNKALTGYLAERGIGLETALPYVREIYYTRGEKRYFALAFANDSGGYELRNAYFKGAHGSKDMSLVKREHAACEEIMVFEGFMDFLSLLVLEGKRVPDMPALVLNSVAMKDRALERIRALGVRSVHLFLDRDDSGRELTAQFQQELAGMEVIDRSSLYRGFKDVNAFLVGQKQR